VLASGNPETMDTITIRDIYPHPVELINGHYETAPAIAGAASRETVDLVKMQDIAGANRESRLLVLVRNSGGSGSLTYAAVMQKTRAEWNNVATAALGDRARVRAMSMSENQLILDLIVAGPDEPVCCPNMKQRRIYSLDGSSLHLATTRNEGPVSAADLFDTTWRLTHLGRDSPVPDGVEVSAEFTADKISGSSGCNRYFAPVDIKDRFDVTIGPAAGTRMMCPPPASDIEVQYLAAIGAVVAFDFAAGDLLLHYKSEDARDALRFIRD